TRDASAAAQDRLRADRQGRHRVRAILSQRDHALDRLRQRARAQGRAIARAIIHRVYRRTPDIRPHLLGRFPRGCCVGVDVMRCLACGAAMRVAQTVPDDSLPVRGYAQRTLECSACGEIERRLFFAGDTASFGAEISPKAEIDPASPAPDTSEAHTA